MVSAIMLDLKQKQKAQNKYSRRAVALRIAFQQAMKLRDLFGVISADLHAESCSILKLQPLTDNIL
jgi:hypothetical protein